MKSKGKTRGSSTARRPPVPTDSHAEIEDWMIQNVMPRLHPIVQRLDELIRETIPSLQYAIKWKKAYYGLPELGWMIEMVAYDYRPVTPEIADSSPVAPVSGKPLLERVSCFRAFR